MNLRERRNAKQWQHKKTDSKLIRVNVYSQQTEQFAAVSPLHYRINGMAWLILSEWDEKLTNYFLKHQSTLALKARV